MIHVPTGAQWYRGFLLRPFLLRPFPPGRYRVVPGYTRWTQSGDPCKIQYCPASKIDEEMEWYVTYVEKILLRGMSLEDKDPFRACAWVQWAFVRIHPFAVGNDRMARLVSPISR